MELLLLTSICQKCWSCQVAPEDGAGMGWGNHGSEGSEGTLGAGRTLGLGVVCCSSQELWLV